MGAPHCGAGMGLGSSAIGGRRSRDRQFRACRQTADPGRCRKAGKRRSSPGENPMTARPSPALTALANIAWQAGEIILKHYANETIQSRRKDDQSPVTAAAEDAEVYILSRLAEFDHGV